MVNMKTFWKTAIVVVCAAVALAGLAGCDQKKAVTEQTSADKPLLAKLERPDPTPLEDIELKSIEALDLASDSVSAFEDDQYVMYVNQAKARDRKEVEAEAFDPLQDFADAFADAFASIATGLTDAFADAFADLGDAVVTADDTAADTADNSDDSSDDTTDTDSYSNDPDAFLITFPSGWTVAEGEEGDKNTVTAVSGSEGSGDKFLENVQVVIEELVIPLTLDELTDSVITGLTADLTNFTEIERSDVEIDGTPAKRILYTHTSGGTSLKSVTYVTVGDLKGYTITGTAEQTKYAANEPIFEAAAESFKFK